MRHYRGQSVDIVRLQVKNIPNPHLHAAFLFHDSTCEFAVSPLTAYYKLGKLEPGAYYS